MPNIKNSIYILSGYGIALILLLYFGLNGLIVNTLTDTFPNAKFITNWALFLLIAWLVGLGIRRYLNSFTKDRRVQIKKTLVGITVLSWIIVLILFSVT